ncbi:Flp pilus assembly protein TadG [Aeromicrobium panaciterrae]|uniref:Flp pilus assembly protein TadG n=1 Tax=Aeromicrobium panaciterrae TaxID=363861 RepID=A0ABU1UKP1_9ACTN|nr:TadE family type IV pilus minor pilin [Aeromicrobium panaciterrae]MDR7085738.1 Flp pilus assembly protein TadG [Aeromicrobium panaciterrae]
MIRHQRGMVTAELATIAPLGVAFAFLLLWIVSLGLTQVRLIDASREGARLVARGESVGAARLAAKKLSPDDAKITITTEDGLVTVTVNAKSAMPIPFFSGIGAREMESSSVAAEESP